MPEPTICVALDSTNVDDMVDEAARASTAGADLVEVRFDRLYLTKPEPVVIEQEDGESKSVMPPEAEWPISDASSIDAEQTIQKLKDSIAVPVIFTCQPPREGGFFPGTEEERLTILQQAIDSGVSWIDIESSIEEKTVEELMAVAKKKGCKIVYSSHDINGTPNSKTSLPLSVTTATRQILSSSARRRIRIWTRKLLMQPSSSKERTLITALWLSTVEAIGLASTHQFLV